MEPSFLILEKNGKKFFQKKFLNNEEGEQMLDKHLFSSSILSRLNILHPFVNVELSVGPIIAMDYLPYPTLSDVWKHLTHLKREHILKKIIEIEKKFYTLPQQNNLIVQHNDLNALNILVDIDQDDIYLIDYADVGYSFKGRDVASLMLDPQIKLNKSEMSFVCNLANDWLEESVIVQSMKIEVERKEAILRKMGNFRLGYNQLADIVREQFFVFQQLGIR